MISARDLSTLLADLLRRERAALAEFLLALSTFDAERRWVELGYASLFDFLRRELGLSKSAAFQRMTAARLIQKFPEVVEPLRDGRLCLSTVFEVSKVITPENRKDVLTRYFHLSRREAMAVSAELEPCEAAPHRTVVTPVRVPAPPALSLQVHREEPVVLPDEPPTPAAKPPERSLTSPIPPPPRPAPAETIPLTADLNRFHMTVSRRFLEKLEAARAALSHSHPGAREEELLEAGLDLLLERHAKRRGIGAKPRSEPRPAKPDHIPAHVMRAVWERDGGRCSFPLEGGGVCGSTYQLQFDHVTPKARGGPSTIENVRVACRPHNDLAARKVFGDAWMNRYTRGGSGPGSEIATAPP